MYCMYLRKSRVDVEAEARGEGETLLRHEKALLELAKRLNIEIQKIYREIVSGETIVARPVMQHVLSEVEQGLWEGVLVMEVERLARGDTIDQGIVAQTFRYSNTKIITPTKTYDPLNEFDEEYFEFGLFMSRREYKTINRRLQRGRIQSVKEGRYLGSVPPYGYVRKKLEHDKGYTLEPDPEQADIVRLIFDLYTRTDRIGISQIVRKLNEIKVPTIKGGPWVPATIQSILHNPVYIGKIRWNARPRVKKMINGQLSKKRPRADSNEWTLVDGLHQAIIEQKTWDLARKHLTAYHVPPVSGRPEVKNPLAGLIVCGKCGRKMLRRPYTNGQKDVLMCSNPACGNVSSSLQDVEKLILKVIKDHLEEYKIEVKINTVWGNAANSLEFDLLQRAIEKLNIEAEDLQYQNSRLCDLLEQGVYSTETFFERSKIIREKKENNKREKDILESKLLQLRHMEVTRETLLSKAENLLAIYKNLKTPNDKNRMLKEVLEKVIYYKSKSARWSPDPYIQLKVFPKLPKKQRTPCHS